MLLPYVIYCLYLDTYLYKLHYIFENRAAKYNVHTSYFTFSYFTELTASFLIVFTVNMVEVMGGVMSLMLHKLSMDIEVQEKIRNNDKIEFNLEGVPHLSLENINRLTFTDTLIESKNIIYLNLVV